jgi:hypothetical protein
MPELERAIRPAGALGSLRRNFRDYRSHVRAIEFALMWVVIMDSPQYPILRNPKRSDLLDSLPLDLPASLTGGWLHNYPLK